MLLTRIPTHLFHPYRGFSVDLALATLCEQGMSPRHDDDSARCTCTQPQNIVPDRFDSCTRTRFASPLVWSSNERPNRPLSPSNDSSPWYRDAYQSGRLSRRFTEQRVNRFCAEGLQNGDESGRHETQSEQPDIKKWRKLPIGEPKQPEMCDVSVLHSRQKR